MRQQRKLATGKHIVSIPAKTRTLVQFKWAVKKVSMRGMKCDENAFAGALEGRQLNPS